MQKHLQNSGGKPLKIHQPCEECGSSDALSIYSDHTYCFSCGTHVQTDISELPQRQRVGETIRNIRRENIIPRTQLKEPFMDEGFTYQYVPWRGVDKSTFETYGVLTKVGNSGEPLELGFPYANGRTKVRSRTEKSFRTIGEASKPNGYCFGVDRFGGGSAQAVTIVEGELDALSAFQLLGSKYPVVSVGSASSARTDCTRDFEWLNSFDKIYLCFDNDKPGQDAVQQVASLFDFNKIYHVKLDKYKDANEYLEKKETKAFVSTWWNAKRFLPEGVISSLSEFDNIIDGDTKKESVSYPFETLQSMTYGIRTGEVVLVKAPEKIGKTEFLRAIEYHLLKTTDANIGVIHLEEGKSRLLKGLAGYELSSPVHLPDSSASKEEIKKALREVTKRDDRLHVYTHFDTDDPDVIVNTIRFMAGPCNCKYIFFDHLSQVVSGAIDVDERRELDYISTKLCNMVEDLDFCLFVISHVNDDGKTRGSRYIAKVADLVLSLHRDPMAENPVERNTTRLMVEGNRFASQTGPAGQLVFNPETFKIIEDFAPPT